MRMKILSLIIKQVYFDQIIAGTKKIETREVLPTTEKKYVVLDGEGGITDIVQYDALRLYVGYAKGRNTCLVEVKGAQLIEIHDEQDRPIFEEQNGVRYMVINIVYSLGKVLKVNDC